MTATPPEPASPPSGSIPSAAPAAAGLSGTVPQRRSPLRGVFAAVAGFLALVGLGSLAALLLQALRGETIWPGLAAGAFYALPLAFLLMCCLVIDGIRRRRQG